MADAVKLIIAQRLARKLCPDCARPGKPSASEVKALEKCARREGVEFSSLPKNYRQPAGCPKCGQTGCRGRTVLSETLEMTPEIGKALKENQPPEKSAKQQRNKGW